MFESISKILKHCSDAASNMSKAIEEVKLAGAVNLSDIRDKVEEQDKKDKESARVE